MLSLLTKIAGEIVDFIFPKEKAVLELEKMADENKLSYLPQCVDNKISWAESVFDYGDRRVRALVWAIKYKENKKLSQAVSNLIYERIIDNLGDELVASANKNFILIPIPLSKKRKTERGFNQVELICEAILKNDQSGLLKYNKEILIRKKDTLPQTSLKRKEWLKNLEGCFEIKNSYEISGAKIILIDDVVTTGSTLSEARKTLISAGAKKVLAFTMAH